MQEVKRAEDTEHAPTQRLRSMLVPADLTAMSDRVLARVARLPLDARAKVTLLHVVPASLPSGGHERARRDAERVLADEAEQLRAHHPQLEIETLVTFGTAADEIVRVAAAAQAELVVLGRGDRRALKDIFLGSTAERVIRRGQLPVLAVRLPARSAYKRPAIALDDDDTAAAALDLLLRVVPHPRPATTLIHAYDSPYQGMIYSSLSTDDAQSWRDEHDRMAMARVTTLVTAALARGGVPHELAPPWKRHIRCGSPRQIIESTVKKAESDLLVLGTRGHTGVAHLFLGTVAGDVLRDVACDVLVVPAGR